MDPWPELRAAATALSLILTGTLLVGCVFPDAFEAEPTISTTGCASCAEGTTCCAGECVYTSFDPRHCGSCGESCGAQPCVAGECRLDCDGGETECSGACVDVSSDQDHCGACGQACEASEDCVGGACLCAAANGSMSLCQPGQSCCPGVGCRDTMTSARHCGACGNVCALGERCVAGACACGAAGACDAASEACCEDQCVAPDSPLCACPGNGDLPCGAGEDCCDEGCIDVLADTANCGACGESCGSGAECLDGACGCAAGVADCDGDGDCETALGTTTDCGSCGHGCGLGSECVGGACVCPDSNLVCVLGQSCCAGACVDAQSDPAHCGGCDAPCPPAADNAESVVCQSGACAPICEQGFGDCDGDVANGCEQPLRDNPLHCGSCDNVCPATASCVERMCTCGEGGCGCETGESECNGTCVDLMTSDDHCGACGVNCRRAAHTVGDARCESGDCVWDGCEPDFADCDLEPATGCEADLKNDEADCGACGNLCDGAEVCCNGVCMEQATCTALACADPSCPAGDLCCGSQCIELEACRAGCSAAGEICCVTPVACTTSCTGMLSACF